MKIDTDFCESGVRINFRFTQEDLNDGELKQMRRLLFYLADRANGGHGSERFIQWFRHLKEFLGEEWHGCPHRVGGW